MNEWMKTVLSLSVSGTLLLLLLLGLKRFYQNRFSRRWQYYILLLAALRFLLPVAPGAADTNIVGSLFHKLETAWSAAQAATGGLLTEWCIGVPPTEPGFHNFPTEPGPIASLSANTDNSGITPAQSDAETIFPAEAKPFDVSACLFSIWAAIALVFFVRRITVYQDFVQYIRAGNREVSDRRILNLLSDCQEKLHVRTRVELSCNPLITSPVMIGFFRPSIILPVNEAEDGALSHISPHEKEAQDDMLSHIFLHELIHYKQKDMFYKWLIQTVICLHWFNPFVYFLGKEVNRACELSCDEKALSLLDEKARRGYGDTLLSFFKPDSPYKSSLASVSLTEGAAQLKERLGAIMKFKKKTKSVIAATVILSAALCVCFWEIGAYAASVNGDKSVDSQHSASHAKVIGDIDKFHAISGQITDNNTTAISGPETGISSTGAPEQAADIEDIRFDVLKTISDERCLYLLFSMKTNDGAFMNPDGRFADFSLYFPGKLMSGAYQYYFMERKDSVPKNELEGVIYADWQADAKAKELELRLRFSDWQEEMMCDDAIIDFDVSETVEEAGENAEFSVLYNWGYDPQYLWQPGDADIALPYGGVSICNAGWENGILQIVMTGPKAAAGCSIYQNWYFVDTRTGKIIKPEQRARYLTQDKFEVTAGNPEDYYIWNFVSVDKEALPYLEMHWGGIKIFATVFPGEWEFRIDETPVTVKSKLLAKDMMLYYAGKELPVDRIECSKLSLAVYFTDYVESTTGILGEFDAFDADENPIRCDWGFTADVNGNGCMIWTRFAEPVDPESICLLTFGGEKIYVK